MGFAQAVVAGATRLAIFAILVLLIQQYRHLRGHDHSIHGACKLTAQPLDNSSCPAGLCAASHLSHAVPSMQPSLERPAASLFKTKTSSKHVPAPGRVNWLAYWLGALLHIRVKSRGPRSPQDPPAHLLPSIHGRMFGSKGACPVCYPQACHPGSWPFTTPLASLEPLSATLECIFQHTVQEQLQQADTNAAECTRYSSLKPDVPACPSQAAPPPAGTPSITPTAQQPAKQDWCSARQRPGFTCLSWLVPPSPPPPATACSVPSMLDIVACLPDPTMPRPTPKVLLDTSSDPQPTPLTYLDPTLDISECHTTDAASLHDLEQCPAQYLDMINNDNDNDAGIPDLTPPPSSQQIWLLGVLKAALQTHAITAIWVVGIASLVAALHQLSLQRFEHRIRALMAQAIQEFASWYRADTLDTLDKRITEVVGGVKTQLQAEHAQALTQLQGQHADIKAQLQVGAAQLKAQLLTEHEAAVRQMKVEHSASIELLQQRAQEMAECREVFKAELSCCLSAFGTMMVEVTQAHAQLSEAQAQLAHKEELIAEMEEELSASGQEIISLQDQLRVSEDQVCSNRKLMDSLQGKLQSAEEQLQTVEQQLAQAERSLTAAVRDLSATQDALDEQEAETEEWKTRCTDMQSQVDVLTGVFEDAMYQHAADVHSEQSAEVAAMQKQLAVVQACMQQFVKEADAVCAEVDTELQAVRLAKHKDLVVVDQFQAKRSRLVEEHLAIMKQTALTAACPDCVKRKEAIAQLTHTSDLMMTGSSSGGAVGLSPGAGAFSRSFSFRG